MVWVFGNSCERVPIKDLNDVIYFRQKKQYSDQEFEGSKDLQREIQKGRVIRLEHHPEVRNSLPDNIGTNSSPRPTVDIAEIRKVITEVVSGRKSEGMKELAVDLIPIIAETVRQEVSRIQVQTVSEPTEHRLKETSVTYVPTVSTEGMVSNIEIKEKEISGNETNEALKALRNLNKITP